MEARSLFIVIVFIIVALIKVSAQKAARRGVKTIGKKLEKNGERMAQAQRAPRHPLPPDMQDAPYRPAPPKGAPQRSAAPPRRPMPPPDVPDAACVVCDNTGEDHFAHDKAQRIAQLDEFLKNGIIDKAEYRTLRDRYERGL